MNIPKLSAVFLAWLPLAILATLFSGLTYVSVQQSLRNGANDPQIQIAEDISGALAAGTSVQSILQGSGALDISKSLYPYIIVYNEDGKAAGGTGTLNNKLPVPPPGVFAFTKTAGEDRITWQPEPGVRSAVVIRHFSGTQSGFVLVGRSLREIEKRGKNLEFYAGTAWIVSLLGTLGAVVAAKRRLKHD
jgi:hypothetical protein